MATFTEYEQVTALEVAALLAHHDLREVKLVVLRYRRPSGGHAVSWYDKVKCFPCFQHRSGLTHGLLLEQVASNQAWVSSMVITPGAPGCQFCNDFMYPDNPRPYIPEKRR